MRLFFQLVQRSILFQARGLTELQAYREAYHLLTLFDMQEKGNNMINELSGGMKKKLSLLMALIGRPDVRSSVVLILSNYIERILKIIMLPDSRTRRTYQWNGYIQSSNDVGFIEGIAFVVSSRENY